MSDPNDEWLYEWVGPDDNRTSGACKAIKSRVRTEGAGKGVPLKALKRIIKDESMKFNGPMWKFRDWQPHIDCRHTAVRSGRKEAKR